ncbi:aldose 1-epimerase [Roseobacter cerasinus]|uniref:Aldose 1-epimerase n=1 Tax=Roseobacter cerasinus TaxID=2602289 RepID=A0A640VJX1_9RHOB|nr:aldose 1-epimerase [Roseobacter cerasinus]GFE48369.1 aldose 1-epimerase [Roseobacter cerasinus]
MVRLRSGAARLELAPAFGGGIARLDVDGRPVLRPWQGDADNPFSLASNILVPFSNRISQGGFEWGASRYALEPNLPGEACPIHGDGFQRRWMSEHSDTTARMTLPDGSIGPWRYKAVQDFSLTDTHLTIQLRVTNTGADALPFGCGFHPWFPRDGATRLRFEAETVWMEDMSYLPTEERDLSDAPEWSFRKARPLPTTWINNGYTGWKGRAVIEQGERAVSCTVSASEDLTTALVFSPDAQSDFFCFEPVSHPVDAFHLPGMPGLQTLENGEALHASMTVDWTAA